MKDTYNVGSAAIWMLLPTLGGVLGFTAIGWYPYLLASAMIGLIAWSMLNERRSRKIFLACVAVAAIAGVAAHSMFLLPNGSISDNGLMLAILPAFLVMAFFAMKVHSIETGDEEDPDPQS